MTRDVRKENIQKERNLFSYWGNVSKVLLAITSYALGLATYNLVANWTNFNIIFNENPLIFWLMSVFLSLLGLYLSIKSIKEKRQITTEDA